MKPGTAFFAKQLGGFCISTDIDLSDPEIRKNFRTVTVGKEKFLTAPINSLPAHLQRMVLSEYENND